MKGSLEIMAKEKEKKKNSINIDNAFMHTHTYIYLALWEWAKLKEHTQIHIRCVINSFAFFPTFEWRKYR